MTGSPSAQRTPRAGTTRGVHPAVRRDRDSRPATRPPTRRRGDTSRRSRGGRPRLARRRAERPARDGRRAGLPGRADRGRAACARGSRRSPDRGAAAGSRRRGRTGCAHAAGRQRAPTSATRGPLRHRRRRLADRWILDAEADDFVASRERAVPGGRGRHQGGGPRPRRGGGLEGRVVDDRGGFVAGVRVQVGRLPADRAGHVAPAWEVDRYLEPSVHFTDEDGKFRAENLRPGITIVKAEREGYVTFYKRNVRPARRDHRRVHRRDDPRRRDGGHRARLDGQALEGAMVAVTKRAPGDERRRRPRSRRGDRAPPLRRTDADGRFEIENIPPGMYSVVVWFAPGHQGWARDQNDKAMRRGIASGSTTVEFRLEAAAQGGGGFGPPRGR